MDGRVKIDFGPRPNISQNIATNRLQIEEIPPSSSSSRLTKRKIPKKKVQTRNSFSTASEALKKRDREIDNELKKLREENLQKMNQLKLLNAELEKSLKLKSVQTSSQISQACYTAHSQNESNEEDEEETDVESAEGTVRPTASDFQVVPPIDPQLGVITSPRLKTLTKSFKPNHKRLNEDLMSELNLERRNLIVKDLVKKKNLKSSIIGKNLWMQPKQKFSSSISLINSIPNKLKTLFKPLPNKNG
jgi:hypothetical protein